MCTALLLIVSLFLFSTSAQAFVVSPFPDDNLLTNPWFHSSSDPSVASLEGWTNVLNNGIGWGKSDKEQNPSPYGEMGTAARWAEMGGKVYPGVDARLYQVVAADSSDRSLKFSSWWVSHRIDILEYVVYGGNSPQGPWTKVWTPFSVTVTENKKPESGNKNDMWQNTGMKETTISQGYPYYKLEIHARYPQPLTTGGSQGVGLKVTGVYFSAQPAGSKPGDPITTVEIPETQEPEETPVVTKTRPPESTPTAEITATDSPGDDPEPARTRPPKTPKPARTPRK